MEKTADNADNAHAKWVSFVNMISCSAENVSEKVLRLLASPKPDDSMIISQLYFLLSYNNLLHAIQYTL